MSKIRLAVVALILGLAQLMMVLISWVVSSAMPESQVRSLLSSEGIRWFFGHFVDHLASPLLVWMLLLSMAWSSCERSGLWTAVVKVARQQVRLTLRQRFGLTMAMVELLLATIIMLALTAIPHAILIGSTGGLFPSSFSASMVPVVAFVLILMSLTYGMATLCVRSLGDAMDVLVAGIHPLLPLFVLYILGCQLFYTVAYVFVL